jgi:hypothetical protein
MLLSLTVGILGLMYFVSGFYGALLLNWLRLASSVGIGAGLLGVAAACYYVSSALFEGLRWGWLGSWAIGFLAAACGIFLIWTNSGEGWGDGIGTLILIAVLPGWIVLLLPSTRRFSRGRRPKEL